MAAPSLMAARLHTSATLPFGAKQSGATRGLATVSAPGPAAPTPKFVPRTIEIDGKPVTYRVFHGEIERPQVDKRDYTLLRLDNDLEVLVISDPTTDKASAAMDVRVGHLSDPADLPGMAHFCEHLLFMGTKKYPRENEYSEYLSNHSGSSNAFTSLENTNYFFDVGHAYLEGALDRFAQFFLEPLFDPSCTEREIRAVDSEHKKNLQSDLWRAFQLEKSLCDPAHPYSKFGTGNAATLWDAPKAQGRDVRAELLQFHETYYSANMMKLVVLGREPTEQLTRWVVDKFANVPNHGRDAPSFPGSPLGPSELGTQVVFKTIKDVRLLDLTFPFPEQVHLYRSKPGQLLSHFIGHEGHGSLFSCLKQRGWANSLSAGSAMQATGFELFKIHIDLTRDGYAHYQDVIAAVFQYLDLLREKPMEQWMYEEVRRLSELKFVFKEISSPAMYSSTLASQLQNELPPAWLLSGPYVLREFDAPLIRQTLDSLRADHCRVMLAGREPPAGVTLDAAEQWYGTEYTVQPLATSAVTGPKLDGLALPRENEFVPQNLDVLATPDAVSAPTSRPRLLVHTPATRLWHKQDDRFFLPKANVFVLLRTPQVNASPRAAVLSRLLVELVKDALCEFSYDAEVAGLHYHVDSLVDGLEIALGGYNDKLPHLLQSVLDTLAELSIDDGRFAVIKDQVKRGYENFDLEEPYQHAAYYSTYLLTERLWTQHEKLKVIDALRPDDVHAFRDNMLKEVLVEMLVHGNADATRAEGLLGQVSARLAGAAPLPAPAALPPRSLRLAPGTRVAWRVPVANAGNVNSSLEYFLQGGDPRDVRLRATLALLAQIAHEPCFDQLRTKEQLGYLVFSGVRLLVGQMGLRVIVQSERDSDYLEGRIDAFFDYLHRELRAMSADDFEAHRRSLIHQREEAVKNLAEETQQFWQSIHSGYYDFENRARDIEVLRTLTRDDILSFFEHYVHPSSPHRAKSVTHLQSRGGATTPLSPEALDAFFVSAARLGMPVPEETKAAVAAQLASVEALEQFVLQAKASNSLPPTLDVAELLRDVKQAARASAAPAAESAALAPPPRDVLSAIEIKDVLEFKRGLSPSADATPVLPWPAYEQDTHKALPADAYEAVPPSAAQAHM